jgi:hypothetical protein
VYEERNEWSNMAVSVSGDKIYFWYDISFSRLTVSAFPEVFDPD